MKKSQYNIEIQTLDGIIIYNSYSGELIELEGSEAALWIKNPICLSDLFSQGIDFN